MEPIEASFIGLKERLPKNISLDQFKELFKDWEIVPIKKNRGAILIKGPELHVSVLPEERGKWFSRKIFNETVGKVIQTYGYAVTSSLKENAIGIKFIEKLGFVFEREENNILYFKILRNKYVRCS